jgi:hypothetical protein
MIVVAQAQQQCSRGLEELQLQQDVQSQQDLIKVTDRLTTVVQLNSELIADNSNLTQQLMVCYASLVSSCQNSLSYHPFLFSMISFEMISTLEPSSRVL